MTIQKPVALIDMDGTLCNYIGAMIASLEELRSPEEPVLDPFLTRGDANFNHLWKRMNLIKADEQWWATLPKFSLGFDVFEMAQELGFDCEILTQSPKGNPAALAGKLKWIKENLGTQIDYTMTLNKSRHYGRVFVDDFPGFIEPWLEHRPEGLVIMPANKYNEDFKHPQVIRYTGENKEEVYNALKEAANHS